jgi:trigger factor
VKAGDEKVVVVTFPEEYGAKNLAGKVATFAVTVKAVKAPKPAEIDDALATRYGMESRDQV